MKKRQSRMMFWGSLGVCVPLAYFSSFAAEGGPPMAEGCSGSGPYGVVASLDGPTSQLKVGRDGFFAFWAFAPGLGRTEVLAAIDAEVHDAADELVPGELTVLGEMGELNARRFALGWQADEPLVAGDTLDVRVTTTAANSETANRATLGVVDETAELALPPIRFHDWKVVMHDTGETRTCSNALTGCGPVAFGGATEEWQESRLAADALPAAPVISAWEYTATEVPGKGTLVAALANQIALTSSSAPSYVSLDAKFRDVLEEYCLLVTMRDLRTDEKLSQEICASPERPLARENRDRVQACTSVEPEFLTRWCEGGDPSTRPACPPAGASGSSAGGSSAAGSNASGSSGGGTAGLSSQPMAGDGSEPVGEGALNAGEDEVVITEAGCGCRLAPNGGRRDAWLSVAALAALGLAWGRRRRGGSWGA
jgi:hypothetical protein